MLGELVSSIQSESAKFTNEEFEYFHKAASTELESALNSCMFCEVQLDFAASIEDVALITQAVRRYFPALSLRFLTCWQDSIFGRSIVKEDCKNLVFGNLKCFADVNNLCQ